MTIMKKKQPNSKMCFICGVENPIGLKLKIYQTSPGIIETSYTAPEHFQGYPGILHGGIVASILDEISGRALMGEPSSPRFMFTGRLQVKYRKNVPTGKPLRIIGKAMKSKERSAEGWAGIYDQEGNLLAEASTLLIDLPKETIDTANLDELGWKIYPD
jgi:acyl-coenzyme A thioesterase PaaI-like protein